MVGAGLSLPFLLPLGDHTFMRVFGNLTQFVVALSAAICTSFAARRAAGRMRKSWIFFALGTGSWAIGQGIWCWYELVIGVQTPFLAPSDVGFLLFPVFIAVALWLFPSPIAPQERLRCMLDGSVALAALVSISWSITLSATAKARDSSELSLATAIAYPVSDVLILSLAIFALSRPTVRRRTLTLITAALFSMTLADSGFALFTASDTYQTGGFVDLGWLWAFLLLSLAALTDQKPLSADPTSRAARAASVSMLPFLPMILAAAVIGARRWAGIPVGRVEMVMFGVALVVVVIRQYLTMRDNRRLLDMVQAREDQLTQQAFHDQLTGLANRSLFVDRLAHALDLHRRDLRPLALLYIDLDDFKAVNDTLGHRAGDELLMRVGERLRGALRTGDTLARFGGDEFAVLIEDGGEPTLIGSRIVDSLREPFLIGTTPILIGASVGVIEVSSTDASIGVETLMAQADIAMYTAKRSGKGQLALYEPTMVLPEASDVRLREPLTRAVRTGLIEVAYQPVVSLATGLPVGFEALARWRFEGVDISPSEFIPLAVRAGLIPALTDHMLEVACRELARWSASLGHSRLRVGVNISPSLITDRGFPDRVAAVLDRHRLLPSQLMLEITEDALLSDLEVARYVTGRLQDLGTPLALDDFGTGHSSLFHLQQIPLHSLKIDISFIANIDRDPAAERFLHALLALGRHLDLEITAEGVEREGQAEILRRLGCPLGQGFLFSRGMRPGDVRVLLGLPGTAGGDLPALGSAVEMPAIRS